MTKTEKKPKNGIPETMGTLPITESNVITNSLDTFVLSEINTDVNIKELAEFAYKFNEVVMQDTKEKEKIGNNTLAQKYIKPEEFKEFNDTFNNILNIIKKYDVESEFIKTADRSALSEIQVVIKYYVSKLSRIYNGILYNVVMSDSTYSFFQTAIKNNIVITGDDMIKMGDTAELLKAISKGDDKYLTFNANQAINLYNFFSKYTTKGVTGNFNDFRNIMIIFEDIYKLYTSMNNLGRIAKERCGIWVNAVSILGDSIEKQ